MGTRGMQQGVTSGRFTVEISFNGSIRMFDNSQIQKGDPPIVKAKGETQVKFVDIQ